MCSAFGDLFVLINKFKSVLPPKWGINIVHGWKSIGVVLFPNIMDLGDVDLVIELVQVFSYLGTYSVSPGWWHQVHPHFLAYKPFPKQQSGGFFLVRSCPLHKQCLLYLSICAMTPFGSMNVLIWKVGSVEKTELTNWSFPPYESMLEKQVSLLSILLIIGINSSIFGFAVPSGSPRYVNGRVPILHVRRSAKWCPLSVVMLSGIRLDFWKLTLSPVEAWNCWRISCSTCNWVSLAFNIISVSSAYLIMGKSGHAVDSIGLWRSPWCMAALRADCRRSATITNRSGEIEWVSLSNSSLTMN